MRRLALPAFVAGDSGGKAEAEAAVEAQEDISASLGPGLAAATGGGCAASPWLAACGGGPFGGPERSAAIRPAPAGAVDAVARSAAEVASATDMLQVFAWPNFMLDTSVRRVTMAAQVAVAAVGVCPL